MAEFKHEQKYCFMALVKLVSQLQMTQISFVKNQKKIDTFVYVRTLSVILSLLVFSDVWKICKDFFKNFFENTYECDKQRVLRKYFHAYI